MNKEQLFEQILKKESFLCVGLDPDTAKIPKSILDDNVYPLLKFNKNIIDATAHFAVAFKLNLAFYEVYGNTGWLEFEHTVKYIRTQYPDILIIADAKRGDIGNSSAQYAKAFFETMDVDALTIAPYMGNDSVGPFLKYKDKWTIILALTSNDGSNDFQNLYVESDTNVDRLYETVLKVSKNWGTAENMMYVVGATKAMYLESIRKIVPEHFLLIPGVGEQGGDLEEVAEYGFNEQCGLLVNSSRGIIHASQGTDFAEAAAKKAKQMQKTMSLILAKKGLLDCK